METQTVVPGEYQVSKLNHLVRHITESLAPATLRNKSLVINDVPEGLLPAEGDFVNVEITEAHEYDLIGRICA